MTAVRTSDRTQTLRTIEIDVSGLCTDRLLHDARINMDFVMEKLIVTLVGNIRDARPGDMTVVAKGRYVPSNPSAPLGTINYGSNLFGAEPALLLALHEGLPASFSDLLAEATR